MNFEKVIEKLNYLLVWRMLVDFLAGVVEE